MNPDSLPNGGPAFPCDPFIASEPGHVSVAKRLAEGMSLRDYFAAKAMHQFLAGAILPEGYDATKDFAMLADRTYQVADAMLKARGE